MTIKLVMDNVEVPIKHIKFSDGSSNVKLELPQQLKDHYPKAYYSISVDPTTPSDNYLWEINLVQNAVWETFKTDFNKKILHLPYLPHARADRVFEKGNAHPLKVFLFHVCERFDEIFLTDPHSDYYKESGRDVQYVIKPQHECFREVVRDIESGAVLVSPDKGATNKIYKLQKKLDYGMISTTVIEAFKDRDITTGRIISTSFQTHEPITGKVVYIVDDICDGGGTFLPLAEELKLKGAKEVHLYVTHGIFAKGLNVFRGKIDKLHVYQTVGTYVNSKDILDFNNGLEVK